MPNDASLWTDGTGDTQEKRPTGAEWAEGRAFAGEQTSVPKIVADMSGEDIRRLAYIISEVDETPRWWPRCKRKRISMLLHLWASLEWTGLDYPTTTITMQELSRRANCKLMLAYRYVRRLCVQGDLVNVTREDGTDALAFSWHVREVVL